MDSGMLLSMCALSLVCVGIIAVLGFLLFRSNIIGTALGILNPDMDNVDDVPAYTGSRRKFRQTMRNKAADLDFDAAIARQRQQPGSRDRSNPPPHSASDFQTDQEASEGNLRGRNPYSRNELDYEIYDDEDDGLFESD